MVDARARGGEGIVARRYADGRVVIVDRFATMRPDTAAGLRNGLSDPSDPKAACPSELRRLLGQRSADAFVPVASGEGRAPSR
jgi:hypothetical protein